MVDVGAVLLLPGSTIEHFETVSCLYCSRLSILCSFPKYPASTFSCGGKFLLSGNLYTFDARPGQGVGLKVSISLLQQYAGIRSGR